MNKTDYEVFCVWLINMGITITQYNFKDVVETYLKLKYDNK